MRWPCPRSIFQPLVRFAHGLPALLAQSAMESRGHCCNDIAGEFCPLNLCCICARKRYGSVKVKVKASLKESSVARGGFIPRSVGGGFHIAEGGEVGCILRETVDGFIPRTWKVSHVAGGHRGSGFVPRGINRNYIILFLKFFNPQ